MVPTSPNLSGPPFPHLKNEGHETQDHDYLKKGEERKEKRERGEGKGGKTGGERRRW